MKRQYLTIKTMAIFSLVIALLGVLLSAIRIFSAYSYAEPLQLQTSGAEFESLFAIWKYTKGLAIYNDRLLPPYNAAMYNWLFYQSYGTFTSSLLHAFGLADPWLPTVARFLTLLGIVATTIGGYYAFIRASTASSQSAKVLALAFALLIGTGPLVGFWVFTVRPDIWATTFEIFGAVCFICNYPKRKWLALLGIALCAYAAWAFKQGSVSFLVSIGCFLLVRKAWKDLSILVAGMATAFALTFVVGQPQYFKNVMFSGYPLDFAFDRGVHNLTFFAVKELPGIALLFSALMCAGLKRQTWSQIWQNDVVLFSLIAVLVSGAYAIPLSFQVGGAENYFFTFGFFVTLCGFALLPSIVKPEWPKRVLLLTAGGWLGLGCAVILVLSGHIGLTNLRKDHVNNMAVKHCIDPLPRPLFVEHPYVSLPWMSSEETYFILSYVYEKERKLGHPFFKDGIGGAIKRGELKTLVLIGDAPPKLYDGASLDRYEVVQSSCHGYTVMTLKSN